MSLPQVILTTVAASAAVGLLWDAPSASLGQERATAPAAGAAQLQFVPNELIVGFHEPPGDEQLAALRGQLPKIIGWRALRHAPHPKNDPTGWRRSESPPLLREPWSRPWPGRWGHFRG